MEFTEDKKKEIEKEVVEKCLVALEQGFIQEDELGEISKFVLEKIDVIKNQEELVAFLRELSNKWHFFSDLLVIESGEIDMAQDKNSVRAIQDLVKKGNLEEAVKLAKQATEQSNI